MKWLFGACFTVEHYRSCRLCVLLAEKCNISCLLITTNPAKIKQTDKETERPTKQPTNQKPKNQLFSIVVDKEKPKQKANLYMWTFL